MSEWLKENISFVYVSLSQKEGRECSLDVIVNVKIVLEK